MTLARILFLAATWWTSAVGLGYEPPRPTGDVKALLCEWRDEARGREVPVKIYLPATASQAAPLIVFSHGLGGTRNGYEYLGRHWAGCGFISAHVQHAGSDDSAWKNAEPAGRMEALSRASRNLSNVVNRPKDIGFVLDRMLALNKDASSPLFGRIDPERIGAAGHSFGGFTTLAVAGLKVGRQQWTDPRIKAAIQMSAPAARPEQRDRAYSEIRIPVFHMTGTRDDSPIGETVAAERRIPFDGSKAPGTCLLILKDGDHMVFSGRDRGTESLRNATRRDPDEPKVTASMDADFQRLILAGSTAFWAAWLNGDVEAKEWIAGAGFPQLVGNHGTFEKK